MPVTNASTLTLVRSLTPLLSLFSFFFPLPHITATTSGSQITWDSRSQLVNGHYMYIYDSPSCNYCHVSFTDRNYYPVTIPGDQFYINFNAQVCARALVHLCVRRLP